MSGRRRWAWALAGVGVVLGLVGTVVAWRTRGVSDDGATTVGDGHWGELEGVVVSGRNEQAGGVVVIFLHGYGGHPDSFVHAARQMAKRHHLRVVMPKAPLREAGARAWWSFAGSDWPGVADGEEHVLPAVPQLVKVRAALRTMVKEVRAQWHPERVVLAGFSQGGLLSMDAILVSDVPVDGVVVLSGGLLAASLDGLRASHSRKPPVTIVHGRRDAVLKFAGAEQLRTLLQKYGYPVTFRPFDGGHLWPPAKMFEQIEATLPALFTSPRVSGERSAPSAAPGEGPQQNRTTGDLPRDSAQPE